MDRYRRNFLLHGATLLAASAALPVRAQIPANVLNLADFGGIPGASGAAIIAAFNQAFSLLKTLGGGSLVVPPGTYNLGTYADGIYLIGVSELQNVEISGYGATLEMTTAAPTITVFFNFRNPSNVTFKGLSFYDHGADLSVTWRGAVCFDVYTTRPCSGFRTVDCSADHVHNFFRSFAQGADKYTLSGCDLHATIKNCYYGLNLKYNGRFSRCDISCTAVRRGFIGYGMKDWDITMRCDSSNEALGSNGFISLVNSTGDFSENCSIRLAVTGSTYPYSALIHFYHQAPGDSEYFRYIRADAQLDSNVEGDATLFLFDHALLTGIAPTTLRTFDEIYLTGAIAGTHAGKIIDNPSVSVGKPNAIWLSSVLSGQQDLSQLPAYIKTFDPI